MNFIVNINKKMLCIFLCVIMAMAMLFCFSVKEIKHTITYEDLATKKDYIICKSTATTAGNYYILGGTEKQLIGKYLALGLADDKYDEYNPCYFLKYEVLTKGLSSPMYYVFYGKGKIIDNDEGEHVEFDVTGYDILGKVPHEFFWKYLLPDDKLYNVDCKSKRELENY